MNAAVSPTTVAAPVQHKIAPTDRGDQEFLPAALSILERPTSPIATAMIVSICGLAAGALLWAWFGRMDIVAVAAGKIQPSGKVRTVQSMEIGRVRSILARNGDTVEKGAVLVELDSDEAVQDGRTATAQLLAARAEIVRRTAVIEAVDTGFGVPSLLWPSDVPETVRRREEAVAAADLRNIEGQTRALDAQRAQKLAEAARLRSVIEHQRVVIATQQERVEMRETLTKADLGTRNGLLDAREAMASQLTVLAGQVGQLEEAARAAEALAAEREKVVKAFLAENTVKRADAARQVDELGPRLAKAELRVERMTLRSPVAGQVQNSSVTSVGQVLSPGQEALRVVPLGEGLEIEVYMPNKDIGFIRVGQEAAIKIEAFPFTRYGMLTAKVVRVATDAISDPEARQSDADPTRAGDQRLIAGAQRMQSLVFPVVLRTEATSITADGQAVPLSPGMAVTAEVKTGTRRLLDYLLSPLVEVTSVAGKER